MEELAAAAVSLVILYAQKFATGLTDRALERAEQASAERLGQLWAWTTSRLRRRGAVPVLEHVRMSPTVQRALEEQLVAVLAGDPHAAQDLERLVVLARASVLGSGMRPSASLDQGGVSAPERSAIGSPTFIPSFPAQLPAAPADFTGHAEERGRLEEALSDTRTGGVCLIHGPGGIGKTSTALQVSHDVSASFPDGQLFVDLRGAGDTPVPAVEVLLEFLQAMGIASEAIPEDAEQRGALYRSQLATRRILILLDNAADEYQLKPLLPGSGRCSVLITSRSPLPLLPVAERVLLPELSADEGTELLSRICGPDRVTANPAATDKLLELCGGLPLALRVAGARLAAFPQRPISRLASDLADEHTRLDLMSFGDIEVRSVFLVSYQACSALQQRAFRLLAALDTPSLPPWVLVPLLDVDDTTATECIDQLLLAHLVQNVTTDVAGERLLLHDLARLFAREIAAREPQAEAEEALQRLFGAYLATADIADAAVGPAGQRHQGRTGATRYPPPATEQFTAVEATRWFIAERPVLLSAVAHSHAMGWWSLCWEITDAMSISMEYHWQWEESRRLHLLALDAADRLGDTGARAALLRNMGEALRDTGADLAQAELCFTEAISLFRGRADMHGLSDSLANLAILQRIQGRLQQSAEIFADAESLFRAIPLDRGLAWTLRDQAVIDRHRGAYLSAMSKLDAALALFTTHGELRGKAWALRTLADVCADQTVGGCVLPCHWYDGPWPGESPITRPVNDPRWAQARACYEEADRAMDSVGDRRARAWVALGRAEMALHEGDHTRAAELIAHTRQEAEVLADHRCLGRALTTAALLQAERKDLDQAIALAETAIAIHRQVFPDRVGEALASLRLTRLRGATGQPKELMSPLLRQTHSLFQSCGMPLPDLSQPRVLRALTRPVPRIPKSRHW